jgi:hypothetical protein
LVAASGEGFEGEEGEVGDGCFVGGDVRGGQVEEVDDADVDLADVVGVVVDEGDDILGEGRVDDEFLVHFAFDAGHVGIFFEGGLGGVFGVDVAADAEGAFGGEAFFAAFGAPNVVEEVAVVVEEGVGDDLLM